MEEQLSDGLVPVGHYRSRKKADESALVLVAMRIPFEMRNLDDGFVLLVDEPRAAEARDQIKRYERENVGWPERLLGFEETSYSSFSLSIFVVLLSSFYIFQTSGNQDWMRDAGIVSSRGILENGEWWRTATALFLHGDLSHLLGNLLFGVFFIGALLPLMGSGLTWLSVLLTGILGNYANVIFYRRLGHLALGASTATFGALGLLTGFQLIRFWRSHKRFAWRRVLIPLGGGLGFLALLGGSQEGNTDYMAHFWGLGVGLLLGAGIAFFELPKHLPKPAQWLLGALSLAIVYGSWALAQAKLH
jgi:rhomboid protease GluP